MNISLETLHEITFVLTTACDKLCKHCCANSRLPNKASVIPFRTLDMILTVLLDHGLRKDTIVGYSGGEPFLYFDGHRTLADVISKTRELGFCNIGIQTGGWGVGKYTAHYEKVFDEIMKTSRNIRLSVDLSYNKYQNVAVDQRITHSVSRLWNHGLNPRVIMAVDVENYLRTYFDFYSLAVLKLGANPEIGIKEIVDDVKEGKFNFSSNRFVSGDHSLLLRPSVVARTGRAKSLRTRFFRPTSDCKYILGGCHAFHFNTRGDAYICAKPHTYDSTVPLGNILHHPVEPLFKEISNLRKALYQRLKDIEDGDYVCDTCAGFFKEYRRRKQRRI